MSEGVATEPASRPRRVLIVDDQVLVSRLARDVLQRASFEVIVTLTGEDAVALIRAGDVGFDAMLLDVTLPRMTGVEASTLIKALLPNLPVIVMSGYPREETMPRFPLGAIAGFIQKPFLPSTLVQMMHAAVGHAPVADGDAIIKRTTPADDVATAAHDLTDLCVSILGFAELAGALVVPGTKVASYVGDIVVAGHRLTTLSRHLKDLATQLSAPPP
jgi:DNA-binding NtrC family response regulator